MPLNALYWVSSPVSWCSERFQVTSILQYQLLSLLLGPLRLSITIWRFTLSPFYLNLLAVLSDVPSPVSATNTSLPLMMVCQSFFLQGLAESALLNKQMVHVILVNLPSRFSRVRQWEPWSSAQLSSLSLLLTKMTDQWLPSLSLELFMAASILLPPTPEVALTLQLPLPRLSTKTWWRMSLENQKWHMAPWSGMSSVH